MVVERNVLAEISKQKIYDENSTYSTQTTRLVEAETVNEGIKNGLNGHFTCAGERTPGHCWLYQMNTLSGPYLNQVNN